MLSAAPPARSEDSATRRAREAEARLKDFGEEAEGGSGGAASGPAAKPTAAPGGLLPDASAAFGSVDGPPAFLDPEVGGWVACRTGSARHDAAIAACMPCCCWLGRRRPASTHMPNSHPPTPPPQATRPLAQAVHRPVSHVGAGAANPASANQLLNKRGQAAGEWDISSMAPKLKEQMQCVGGGWGEG